MKASSSIFKRVRLFAKDNYILAIIVSMVLLVGFIVLFKMLTAKEETVYAKVKVSQGLWWASTQRPLIWMVSAFKKGDRELSLTGKAVAEILEVRHYPLGGYSSGEQYDIFMLVKLEADKNSKTGKYTFKRSTVAVGSPIDFEFPKAQISGTVIALSDNLFDEKAVVKTITLRKAFASPWEYEGITIGDTYHDGKEIVVEVLDKSVEPSFEGYSGYGNNYAVNTEKPVNIDVTVKMRLTERNNSLIFKEDIPLQHGRKINFQSDHFFFDQYSIIKIHN